MVLTDEIRIWIKEHEDDILEYRNEQTNKEIENKLKELSSIKFYTSQEASSTEIKMWKIMRERTLKRFNYKCNKCGNGPSKENCYSDMIMDHIIAIGNGGLAFDEANVQLLCINCDSEKTSSDLRLNYSKNREYYTKLVINRQKENEELDKKQKELDDEKKKAGIA